MDMLICMQARMSKEPLTRMCTHMHAWRKPHSHAYTCRCVVSQHVNASFGTSAYVTTMQHAPLQALSVRVKGHEKTESLIDIPPSPPPTNPNPNAVAH